MFPLSDVGFMIMRTCDFFFFSDDWLGGGIMWVCILWLPGVHKLEELI